jgi:lysophospholipase L1-like esterase
MIIAAAALLASVQGGAPEKASGNAAVAIRCSRSKAIPISAQRTVFFGDSITAFWGVQPAFRSSKTWINKGAGGDTAQNGRWRLCRDVIDARPAIVHVMFGTNDLAENAGHPSVGQVFSYITQIVETLRANHIKVVLASVLPTAQFPWKKELRPAAKVIALNRSLKEYALNKCIPYADYWSSMSTESGALKPLLTKDGVHPNAEGYAVMQPIAQRAILETARGCATRHG